MARPNLLSGFDLMARTVCDLGANLGEIARDIRRSGAAIVDAYEYDEFFTQLARYITAYNALSDVNHFSADVSQAGFMRSEYDVCVGLSAFSFMRENIDDICGRTKELMIVETHEITDETWPDAYVKPIARHFPNWCCYGRVSHGVDTAEKHRLWLAFSKSSLTSFYERRASEVEVDAEGLVEVDLARSWLGAIDELKLDEEVDPMSAGALASYGRRLEEYEERFARGDRVNISMSGKAYWLALLCAIGDFLRKGSVADDHVYFRWFKRGLEAGKIDPGLKYLLEDPAELRERLMGRLAALSRAFRDRSVSGFSAVPVAYNVTPYHTELEQLDIKQLALRDSNDTLAAPLLDGHHRLLLMRLLGETTCRMVTIWDPSMLGQHPHLGRVENYERRMYQYLAGAEVEEPVVERVAA